MIRIDIKTWMAIAALAVSNITADAQPARKLSLDEAVQLSVQNSNQLKLNVAKIAEATAATREAQERRLPDLAISGNYMRLNEPTLDLKLKLGSSQQAGENTSGNGSGSSSVKVNDVAYAIANLSVPVFAGFKIQHGIDAAEYLEKAARLDAEKDREEVVQNTIAAYSNLYKSKAALDIVRENLKQSQQRVSEFSNLEQNGVIARNDLLKAQLQQSNVEMAVLEAENNWKITYITMNLMLGLDENTELEPDAAAFNTQPVKENFDEWESKALQNRKDLAAIQARKLAAGEGVKAAKGDYYPSLAVTGGYIAADIPNVLVLTNAVNAGFGIRYSPSSLWKTGSKVAQAKARLQQVETTQNILTDNVRLQTAQAYQNYLLSIKKIDVYKKAKEQAAENYRIVKNKYDNSLATTSDLLEADVAQLQGTLNYTFAQADAMVAYNKLLQTTGITQINN